MESSFNEEVKKEDLNGYFERVKKALTERTLELIKLAPDNSKAEVLERALTFFGSLSGLADTLDIPNQDIEVVQESISQLAEKAGLDPEIISIPEYQKLINEVDQSIGKI